MVERRNNYIFNNVLVDDKVTADSISTGEVNNTVNIARQPGADLGEKLNNARAAEGLDGNRFDVPPDDYVISTPVDYTETSAETHELDLQGANISLETDGTPAFDFTGIGRCKLAVRGGRITTNGAVPESAMLLARGQDYDDAAYTRFEDLHINGEYAIAPFTNAAAEALILSGCEFNNDNNVGHAMAACQSNSFGATSVYSQVHAPGGQTTMSTTKVERCGFRSGAATGDGVIYLDGAKTWTFENCFYYPYDNTEHVHVSECTEPMNSVQWSNCQVDSGASFVHFTNDQGVEKTHERLAFDGGHLSVVDLFTTAGANAVTLRECDLGGNTPHVANGGNVTLSGGLVYSTVNLNKVTPDVDRALKNLFEKGGPTMVTTTTSSSGNIYFDTETPQVTTD